MSGRKKVQEKRRRTNGRLRDSASPPSIGYMRVSKADGSQVLDLQKDALLAAGVSARHLYSDTASGKKDDRPGLASCLQALREGDTLVVWKLDRLGRSLRHLVNVVHDLTNRRIGLKVPKAEYDATPYDAKPSEILVDIIGLGAGVYDRCKELGLPVRGINVGEVAASRDNCMRLRDELWFKGREWFQDKACSMPKDDALIAELTAPTYAFTSTGKMVVESKADMKKRGMRSPDLADAFLLTFACGERKIERYRKPVRRCSAWAL
jgi:hypothetical protein